MTLNKCLICESKFELFFNHVSGNMSDTLGHTCRTKHRTLPFM